MSKLTYEDKLNIYQERKQGNTLDNISKKYGVRKDLIKYLIRLIDHHGYNILRTNKNKYYSSYQKEQIINRVLIGGESSIAVSIDEGLLSNGILFNWITKYKENSYNKEIFFYHKERYGYRRITLELRNQGYNVNHKKDYRLMVKLGLKPLKRNKRKYSSYKGTVDKIIDNHIDREFEADKPNKK